MRIINPRVQAALDSGAGLKLNLGCGLKRREGFFGVDQLRLPTTDILADLNEPLALLPDQCVTEVFSRHTLEHVREFIPLMGELHRVCRPDAVLDIVVPHFSNPYFYSDPTHVRPFGLYTFFYFADDEDQPTRKVPTFYATQRFTVASVEIELMRRGRIRDPISFLLQWWTNKSIGRIDWYERRICRIMPAESIRFQLRVKTSKRNVAPMFRDDPGYCLTRSESKDFFAIGSAEASHEPGNR